MSDDVRVVELTGEYDMSNAHELSTALNMTNSPDRVVADLRSVTFMDSAALSQLLLAHRSRREGGGTLVLLLAGTGAVRRIVQITRIDEVLPCSESYADALSLAATP